MSLNFLVYLSRSGSTFLASRLDLHHNVTVLPESRLAPIIYRWFSSEEFARDPGESRDLVDELLADPKTRDWGVPRDALESAIRSARPFSWDQCVHAVCACYRDRYDPGSEILLLKKGGWNGRKMEMLLETFPESRVVVLVRDPRAIYASGREAQHSGGTRTLSRYPNWTAQAWNQLLRTADQCADRFPGRVQVIRYEDLLEQVGETVRGVWAFLGAAGQSYGDADIEQGNAGANRLVSERTAHLHPYVGGLPRVDRIERWREKLSWLTKTIIMIVSWRHGRRMGYW